MESGVLELRWEETFDFWEMCDRKINEMRWKSTRKWEKTKKHKNSKKKLGFVIGQYQFLSMRLRDEEKDTVTKKDEVTKRTPTLDWERQRDTDEEITNLSLNAMLICDFHDCRAYICISGKWDLRGRASDIWETENFLGWILHLVF